MTQTITKIVCTMVEIVATRNQFSCIAMNVFAILTQQFKQQQKLTRLRTGQVLQLQNVPFVVPMQMFHSCHFGVIL